MSRTSYELSDVIKRYLSSIDQAQMPYQHLKTLSAISRCRTAELGGHLDQCDSCGHLRISYNSCRNRHCNKCQGLNKEMWIIQQEDMLLPVAYYHVVFTMPHELNLLCMHHPRQMYNLLFRAAWHTLSTLAKDPQWIGAKIGATMILHSWSQSLGLHPHVHCIVPNGGLTQSSTWQFPKKGRHHFLFPVVAMKKIYKGFFMRKLKEMISSNQIILPEAYLSAYGDYRRWKNHMYRKSWVVFTKKPFSQSKHVINYLGRYSHRVAITNHRIQYINDEHVDFSYKDYKQAGVKKMMRLSIKEFIRRFRLHILPPHFRKVRTYGILSNASKAKDILAARKALGYKHRALLNRSERKDLAIERLFGQQDINDCPVYQGGNMKMIFAINHNRPPPEYILNQMKRQNSKTKSKTFC